MRLNKQDSQILDIIANYVRQSGREDYYYQLEDIISRVEKARAKHNISSAEYKRKKRKEDKMFARSKREIEKYKESKEKKG